MRHVGDFSVVLWAIFRAVRHVGDFSRRLCFLFCPKRVGAFDDATISRSFPKLPY